MGSVISGGAAVTVNGGTMILAWQNRYLGGTTINAGCLKLGVEEAIPWGPGSAGVTINGTLDLNGHDATLDRLSGNGTVTSSLLGEPVTLRVGFSNQSSEFSGRIEDGWGMLSVMKYGSGTFTLSGVQPNAYTGGTIIQGGTLAFDRGKLGEFGAITFAGFATLKWNDLNTEDISSRLAFGGVTATLYVGGSNVVTLAANLTGDWWTLNKAGSGTIVLSGTSVLSNVTISYHRYDADGRLVLTAEPSAFVLYGGKYYDEALPDLVDYAGGDSSYLSNTAGLFQLVTYYDATSSGIDEDTAGGVKGYLHQTALAHGEQSARIGIGQSGGPVLQTAYDYFAREVLNVTIYPVASETIYTNEDGTGAVATTYGYTWYD